MRKHLLLVLSLLASALSTAAQDAPTGEPAFAMATQGAAENGQLLTFSAKTSLAGIYVDFGNGTTRSYPYPGTVAFSDNAYGDTIKVWPLSEDDPITEFSCKNNRLTELKVNAPSLLWLNCSGNALAKLEVDGCTQLQQLYAGGNKIDQFKLDNPNLVTLDMQNNLLERVEIEGCTGLQTLNLKVNMMRAALFLKFPKAEGLKYLDVSCNSLYSFDTSAYPNLETYLCNNNKYTALDVSKNTKLKTLTAYYNTNLKALDVSMLPLLESLSVGGTKLTSIDVSHNPELRLLSAFMLDMAELDVTANTKLEELEVPKCKLTALDLTKNTALRRLDYAEDSIPALDLKANTALTYLDCTRNGIETLDLSTLAKLDTLVCPINSLAEIDLSKNPLLGKLDVSSNKLSALDLKANKQITFLNVADNTLTALSLEAQTKLEGLDVRSNQMQKEALDALFMSLPDINGLAVDDDDALWKGVVKYASNPGSSQADASVLDAKGWKDGSQVSVLGDASARAEVSARLVGTRFNFAIDSQADVAVDWGDGNKVVYPYSEYEGSYRNPEGVLLGTTLKIYAPEAVELGIANNSVEALNVGGMPNLARLGCSGNQLAELDLSKNEALQQLNCSNNPLTSLELGGAKSLTSLNCEKCLVRQLDLSQATELQSLDARENRIADIDLSPCTKLTEVELSANGLKAVDLTHAPELTTAYLTLNELESIDLTKNTKLQYVNVEKNRIGGDLDLSAMADLMQLYCNDNQLAALKVASSRLTVLMAGGNKLESLDLTQCPNLTTVEAEDCRIASADLSSCTNLSMLWLGGNGMTDLKLPEEPLARLTLLNVRDNKLTQLDFTKLPAVTELVVENNMLSGELDLTPLQSVQKVAMSGNEVETVKLPETSTLTTLMANDNKLKSLRVPSTSLYWLEAKDNQLVAVDLSKAVGLYLAHLDRNKINSLNLASTALVSLSLTDNLFGSDALNSLYDKLPDVTAVEVAPEYADWMRHLNIEGNPGAVESDRARAEEKGWTLDVTGTSAINTTPEAAKAVASEQWYDLQGRAVEKPTSGIYLRTVTYEDGTKATTKVVLN